MRGLNTILEERTEAAKVAATDLADIPYANRYGWGSHIERAKEDVKRLEGEYSQALLASTCAVFLLGDPGKQEEFKAIAKEIAEVPTVETADLYRRLAAPVDAALGASRTFTSSMIPILLRGVKEVGDELSLREIAAPRLTDTPILPSSEDVVGFVRSLIRDSSGDGLNRLYMERLYAKQAIALGYDKSPVPVLVMASLPEEIDGIEEIFAVGAARVELKPEDVVDTDFVVNTFIQAKKAIKKEAS